MAGSYVNYKIPEVGFQRLAGMIIGTAFSFIIEKEKTKDISDTKELTCPLRANTTFITDNDIEIANQIVNDVNTDGNDFITFKDINSPVGKTGVKKKKMFLQTKHCRMMTEIYHVAYRIAKNFNTMTVEERISQKTLTKPLLDMLGKNGLATWLMFSLDCKAMELYARGEHTTQCRKNLRNYMIKTVGLDHEKFSVEINPRGGTVVKFKDKNTVKYLINYCRGCLYNNFYGRFTNNLKITRSQDGLGF